MDYSTGIDYIRSRIEEEKLAMAHHIVKGNTKDFSEYQRLCGVIQGLDVGLMIVNDLAKKHEETGDE